MYKTKQREKILDVLKETTKLFTVKEIYEKLSGVSLTTVYREVDTLVSENKIKKIVSGNNIYYQFLDECDSNNHFYLKCDKCGNLIHIDCDCILDLQKHVLNKHQFKVTNENIMINGICHKCIERGN